MKNLKTVLILLLFVSLQVHAGTIQVLARWFGAKGATKAIQQQIQLALDHGDETIQRLADKYIAKLEMILAKQNEFLDSFAMKLLDSLAAEVEKVMRELSARVVVTTASFESIAVGLVGSFHGTALGPQLYGLNPVKINLPESTLNDPYFLCSQQNGKSRFGSTTVDIFRILACTRLYGNNETTLVADLALEYASLLELADEYYFTSSTNHLKNYFLAERSDYRLRGVAWEWAMGAPIYRTSEELAAAMVPLAAPTNNGTVSAGSSVSLLSSLILAPCLISLL